MRWNLSHFQLSGWLAFVISVTLVSSLAPRGSIAADEPPAIEEPLPASLEEEADSEETAPAGEDSLAAEPQAVPESEPFVDPYAEPVEASSAPLESASSEPSISEDEPKSLEDAGEPAPLPRVAPPADDAASTPVPSHGGQPKLALDPASLDGVRPGITTRVELHKQWGKPVQSQRVAGGAREFYDLQGLGRVQAAIFAEIVNSLTVQVAKPMPLTEIAKRLELAPFEPAEIFDEAGELLGAVYPERGVLLGYLPRSKPPQVFQVVVEPIDAQHFVARADARLDGRYELAIADVQRALSISSDHPQALHLHGELMLRCGRLEEALQSAQRAADLEPDAAGHRLLVARALATAGDYPAAITCLRELLEEPKLEDLDAARAALYYGDYLGQSAKRDFAEALKRHQRAIELAEPLMASKDRTLRRAAKEVLLGAHLGVAYDIGHGHWQQKTNAVAKWVDRAAVFAEDLMRKENAGSEPRLDVYIGALAAIAGIDSPPDVAKWVAGTRTLGQKLFDDARDPLRRAEIAWQLSRALSEAVKIETDGGRGDDAYMLGTVALALMDEAAPIATGLPTYNYHRGRLCYRIGAAYALARNDHVEALVWFERASPLLEAPVPAAAVESGSQGETFVSMGVSYWEQQSRDEALRLTNQGLRLMELAVEGGTLAPAALAVPYGNLSVMHEELGDAEQAKWCADLARRYEGSSKK